MPADPARRRARGTPASRFRIPAVLKALAKQAAAEEGVTLTDVVVRSLVAYVRERLGTDLTAAYLASLTSQPTSTTDEEYNP